MLEGEQPARASEAGLHLIDAEQRAVAAAELLRGLQVSGRWQMHALSLYRLDEEDGDILPPQLRLEHIELTEGDACEAGKQRAEAPSELGVAVRRERAERQAVEAVVGGDDPLTPCRGATELESPPRPTRCHCS